MARLQGKEEGSADTERIAAPSPHGPARGLPTAREAYLARAGRRRALRAAFVGLAIYAGVGLALFLAGGLLLPGKALPTGPLWLDLGAAAEEGAAVSPARAPRSEAGTRASPPSTPIPAGSPDSKVEPAPQARDEPVAGLKPTPAGTPAATLGDSDASVAPHSASAAGEEAPGAAATGSPSGGGAPGSTVGADPAEALLKGLAAFVETHKSYPEAARRRGTEGRVGLAFSVDGQGRLLSLRVANSSGSALLDAAAKELLASAFPLAGPGRKLELSLTIRYSLARP